MKNITIQNKSEVSADGRLSCFRCKPVICITTGKIFTSVTDAAEYAGCVPDHMVNHLKGKRKVCKGKQYCYLTEVNEHLSAITARLQNLSEMEDDAKRWRAQEAEQQRIREAEEKVQNYRNVCTKLYERYLAANEKYEQAQIKLEAMRAQDELMVAV